MSTFSLPDLSQEQQDIFQNDFTKDFEYFKSGGKLSPSFCTSFIMLCKAPVLSILTDKEAQALLQLTDPPEMQEAVLTTVKGKGTRAIVTFYMLLNMNNEDFYGELPSSKENDRKFELISNLEERTISKLRKNMKEISQTFRFSDKSGAVKPSAAVATVKPRLSRQIDEIEETSQEETADSKDEVVKEKKKESQIIGAVKPSAAVATVKPVSRQKEETEKKSQEETADSKDEVLKEKKKEIQITERRKGREKEKRDDGKNNSCDDDVTRPKGNRKSWGIRKDDEFFHFIIICFAVGASLISSYNYADWTVSAGIGLMVFASLETIGIYFGLIQRIRTAVEAFLPLLSKSPFTGFRKNQ
ncbi:uncharacterized protein LOC128666270 [Bombina bombina]|uniref:uncharacterized protein LOC128666270 n=1 Tax=Bombina bombina TaxID=8345 RepID=UPI00235AC667|nr:uncharacterized protein LOC128666270 [Bombina bombina]